MWAGSGGGRSQSSSHAAMAGPVGWPRVEVNAARTGVPPQGGVPINATIPKAHTEYTVPNIQGAAPSGSNSAYALYSPYAVYYPAYNQNPTTSYNATSTQNHPCKIHGPGNPYTYNVYGGNPCANYGYQAQQSMAPAGGGMMVVAPGGPLPISAGPVAPGTEIVKQEKRVTVDGGREVVEEYLNDQLIKRTVNGVPQPIDKN